MPGRRTPPRGKRGEGVSLGLTTQLKTKNSALGLVFDILAPILANFHHLLPVFRPQYSDADVGCAPGYTERTFSGRNAL